MSKRRRVSRSGSKKLFTKTGIKTHKMNLSALPMRGGLRI